MTSRGSSPAEPGSVFDGLGLVCAGVAGWGIAPMVGHGEAAVPVFLTGALGGLLLIWFNSSARRRSGGVDARRILAAAATELKVAPEHLTLRRAKWRRAGGRLYRRRRGLTAGEIRYPTGAVSSDASSVLAKKLRPFAIADLTVTWKPTADRFVIARRILGVLDTSKAAARVMSSLRFMLAGGEAAGVGLVEAQTKVDTDGTVLQLTATYPRTTRDLSDEFQGRVLQVLEAKAPPPSGAWRLRWNTETHTVTVLPADPLPTFVEYPITEPVTAADRLVLPLGVGEGGTRVDWRLLEAPHMLLSGGTGGGKTFTINTGIVGALARGWRVLLVDPKELSFIGLVDWPGIEKIATTDAEMEDAIIAFYDEMRSRYSALKAGLVREQDLVPWLMVADESAELLERLTAYHVSEEKRIALVARLRKEGEEDPAVLDKVKVKGTKNPELAKIWSFLRLGRQARMFVEVATQRPDVSFIPGEARSNARTRISMGHMDATGLTMVHGTRTVRQRSVTKSVDPITGETVVKPIPGRGTFSVIGGASRPFQGYYVPDPSKAATGELSSDDQRRLTAIVEWIRAQRSAHDTTASRVTDLIARTVPEDQTVTAQFHQVATVMDTAVVCGLDVEGWPETRVDEIAPGTRVALDFDGELTEVEVLDSEPDDLEPDSWLLSFKDPDGLAAVAHFASDDSVPCRELEQARAST